METYLEKNVNVFTNIFPAICRILLREKKGLEEDSISEELQKLVTKNYSSNISKETCNRALIMDLGIASYYLNRVGAPKATIASILNENYVYIKRLKRQDFPEETIFEIPVSAICNGEEMGNNQI